jgi:hypothetical protein
MAHKRPQRKSGGKTPADRLSRHEEIKLSWFTEKIAGIFVCGIFLLHSSGLVSLFTPLQGLFDPQPLIDQDWGLHFHHLNSLSAFWRQDHAVWGYNPFFMGGYPSNTIQDLSIKFFEFFALTLSAIALSPVQWLKIGAFLAMASVPWTMYFAARNLFILDNSKHIVATAAAFWGTVYWWNSLPREMFFYGMIGFPIASYLSVLGVSLFYRLAVYPQKFGWLQLGWLMFAAAILPLHVQSIVIFLPPMVTLLLLQPRLISARLIVWIAAAAALCLLINLAWLIPAFNHRIDDVSSALTEQLQLFVTSDPLIFVKDYLSTMNYWSFRQAPWEKGLRLVLLICGAWGIRKLISSDKRDLGIMLASALIILFLITYFGALVPFVKAWQPLRFKVPFDLLLAISASYTVSAWLSSPKPSRSPLVPILAGLGLVTFLFNLAQTESTGRLQLRSRFIPELIAVSEWIGRETPSNARVLFEESGDESGFVYDRTYLSSFLPYMTGRQLIGGPINLYNDRHHFAEFHSGKMFKKDARSLSDEELRNYLRLYNIGAVVAFDPAMIQRLRSIPGLVTIEQRIGPIHLMRVNQPLTWFVEGEGKVNAGFNRLELSDLKGKDVILKFHWVNGLTAVPPVKIEPVNMADDPIPFIKLINPPAAVTLRIASSLLAPID